MTVQAHDSEEGMGATCFTSGIGNYVEVALVAAPQEPSIHLITVDYREPIDAAAVDELMVCIEERRYDWYMFHDSAVQRHILMNATEAALCLDFLLLSSGGGA